MAGRKFTVELLYDIVSPYSYLGFEVLTRCNHEWQSMNLKLRPVLAGGIFKGLGIDHTRFVPSSKSRQRYNRMELDRLAKYFDIPFQHPNDFVALQTKGSLRAQRVVTAVQLDHPDKLELISRQLAQRVFIQDLDIYEDISLLEVCTEVGFSAVDSLNILDRTLDEDVKMTLKNSTEKAVEEGVFGVPTYILRRDDGEKELFFGSDRIFLLAHELGERFNPKKSMN